MKNSKHNVHVTDTKFTELTKRDRDERLSAAHAQTLIDAERVKARLLNVLTGSNPLRERSSLLPPTAQRE